LENAEQKTPEYYNGTITGRVPSIKHNDFWLAESSAIVEYLDDVFPAPGHPSLLPQSVKDKARARQLMAWFRSDLGALREERSTTTMFYEKADKPLSSKGAEAAKKLLHVAEILIPDDSGFLFGKYSIVDSELTFMLERLIINDFEVPPKVKKYAEQQWSRSSVQEFVKHQRKTFVPYN